MESSRRTDERATWHRANKAVCTYIGVIATKQIPFRAEDCFAEQRARNDKNLTALSPGRFDGTNNDRFNTHGMTLTRRLTALDEDQDAGGNHADGQHEHCQQECQLSLKLREHERRSVLIFRANGD